MNLERLAYLLFGNNLIIGAHIRKQIETLKKTVPPQFQHRQTDDLGCGDGKITLYLKDILQPTRLRGFDIDPGLVRRARRRGIDAEVINLNEKTPEGELAILWGVLHHLKDMAGCLERVKTNYPMLFIREPLKTGKIRWLELGHPLGRDEIEELIAKRLPGARTVYCGNNIFIFYVNPAVS